jgi:hypothetical protein
VTGELEPLPPDVERLLVAERTLARMPEDAQARVLARLVASVGPLSGGPAGGEGAGGAGAGEGADAAKPGGAGATAAALAGALVIGALLGAAGHAALSSGGPALALPAQPIVIEVALPATAAAPAEAVAPVEPSASAQARDGRRAVRADASAAPAASARDHELAAERALLEVARTALARGQPAEALAALAGHAKRFPKGRLAEERESLTVQALAAAGRPGEARERAERFRRRSPNSILLPAVESALAPSGSR